MKQDYNNYYKDYYQKNKDKIRSYRRKRYQEGLDQNQDCKSYKKINRLDSYSREWKMWNAARSRARKEGLPFNIEVSDINIPERCPILDIELDRDFSDKTKQSSPSLDKIIPEYGYVKGNIAVISLRANSMKRDLTIPIINRIKDYISKNLKTKALIESRKKATPPDYVYEKLRSEVDPDTV